MPFNTFNYFLFLPIIFLLHYFIPDRFRWLVLLGASFYFYAALKSPHLIAVLLLIATITYFAGILIDRNENPRSKQYILFLGIFANVLTLIILKYLPFISLILNIVLNLILPGATVPISKAIIAIGTSYFIFQAISYLIDIYLEVEKPERHFGYFALYMSFFPKLLQGPIERAGDLIPQLKKPYVFDYSNARFGIVLFTIGLIKKVVISDRLNFYIFPVTSNIDTYSGTTLLLSSYLYYLRLYFDFSGYTDMAIGSAYLFNIYLTNNFRTPYLSVSIIDFWRRWHISFSKWLFDYIFNPLVLYSRNKSRCWLFMSALITFTVSGIWHGAKFNYVIWGVLNGVVFYITYIIYKRYKLDSYIRENMFVRTISIMLTFNIVSLLFLFFNNDASGALSILNKIFSLDHKLDKIYPFNNLIGNVTLLATLLIGIIIDNKMTAGYILSGGIIMRWFFYILLLFMLMFMTFTNTSEFIYFTY